MIKITHEKISKMRRINMSIDQFLSHTSRLGYKIQRSKISKLEDGEFLAIWQKENGKMYRIHLKKIYIKYFNLKYSNMRKKGKKAPIGREMFISSFPLPRGKVI